MLSIDMVLGRNELAALQFADFVDVIPLRGRHRWRPYLFAHSVGSVDVVFVDSQSITLK